MFGENAKTLSTRDDLRDAAITSPYYLGSRDAQDQQTVAASSALCSLNCCHQQDSLESDINNNHNFSCFHNARLSPPFSVYENTNSDERHACPAPPMPNHDGIWGHIAREHLANQSSASFDPSHGYGEGAMPSMLTPYGLPVLDPFQQQNPSSETSSLPYSVPSTPATSMYASSRAFNSPPCSTIDSESGEMHPRMYLMEHAKSTRKFNAPYAKLIERALLEAEGNRMFLKDIYTWIETNTNKADNPSSKGWKNSVRHNLSMNGVSVRLIMLHWFFALTLKGFHQDRSLIPGERQISQSLHVDAGAICKIVRHTVDDTISTQDCHQTQQQERQQQGLPSE